MGRTCEVCGRGTQVGQSVPRKGLAKKRVAQALKLVLEQKEHIKLIFSLSLSELIMQENELRYAQDVFVH